MYPAKQDLEQVVNKFGLKQVEKALVQIKEENQREEFRHNWNIQCRAYGLDSTDFEAEFSDWRGEVFKVIGIKPRNRKYPIIAERKKDGKHFKFNENDVRKLLGKV